MVAAGRQRQRPARRGPEQAGVWVERVEQRKEVRLVDTAAVQQDERAGGLAARRAQPVDERVEAGGHAHMLSGASTPARSSTRAMTMRVASHSTRRKSSSSAGSAPTTRQSL